ncbi:MAG: outer membrane lipoprotein carrier protein LolA [Verrucomicrobiota bacterium]
MRYPLLWIALNCLVAAFFIVAPAQMVAADPAQDLDLAPVKKWLTRMAGMKSIEATFVQQKYLRTLRRPLSTKGHIWIQYPDDFRWELGEPAATVAIRNQDVLTLLEPKKKRAKRYSLVSKKGKSSAAVSAAMDSASKTFPRSMEELEKHFEILGLRRDGEVYEFTLKPKDKSLTVAMRKVLFFIDAEKFHLRAFEIQLRDKSRVRTTFTWIKFNPKIPVNLLKPDLSGYKLKE